MSVPDPSRRTVLAGLSTVAVGTLAGCSSLPGVGDEDESPSRNWLYDQRDYTDGELQSALWFESPTKLVAAEEHLPDDVQGEYVAASMNRGPDLASVEWAMLYQNELLAAPAVRAYGGSFDSNTARETTAAYGGDGDDELLGTVDEYELVAYDEGRYGLYRDGEAVTVDFAGSEDVVRDLVADRAESPSNLADSVQQLIDRVGFGTTASVNFETADGSEFTGTGIGYTVDDETTTVRFVHLNGDMSLDQLRAFGNDIEALSVATVDEEGPVRWLEGTVDTDRTALDGTMVYVGEAPYE